MDDVRIGATLRAIRVRQRLTQDELGIAAGVSRAMVGRVEHGMFGSIGMDSVRRIAAALGASIDVSVRWQAGDLGRLVNARHAAVHDVVARRFGDLPGWAIEPEVSFASYGERGVIDILAWHRASRSLLVIELKSEFVDVNELMGGVDRKRRLAGGVARDRDWSATTVSTWVVVADGRTNRRQLARHAAVLRAKFPADGHAVAAWLRRPRGSIQALGFVPVDGLASGGAAAAGTRRVHHARSHVQGLAEPDR